MLKNEIHNMITRYAKESDLTYYEVVAVLELVKLEVFQEMLKIKKS